MSRRILNLAEVFVATHGLGHSRVPVDLSLIYDRFVPVYEDLSHFGILGHGMFPPSGDVTVYQPARIVIDASLSAAHRRLVYVHEIGHFIAGHTSTPATVALNSWLDDRHEREAWLAGVALLMPVSAIHEDEVLPAFAARAGVPLRLARLYWEAAGCFL